MPQSGSRRAHSPCDQSHNLIWEGTHDPEQEQLFSLTIPEFCCSCCTNQQRCWVRYCLLDVPLRNLWSFQNVSREESTISTSSITLLFFFFWQYCRARDQSFSCFICTMRARFFRSNRLPGFPAPYCNSKPLEEKYFSTQCS